MGNISNEVIVIFNFIFLALGVLLGVAITHNNGIHTEKYGCEYVHKTECKQVWIKG